MVCSEYYSQNVPSLCLCGIDNEGKLHRIQQNKVSQPFGSGATFSRPTRRRRKIERPPLFLTCALFFEKIVRSKYVAQNTYALIIVCHFWSIFNKNWFKGAVIVLFGQQDCSLKPQIALIKLVIFRNGLILHIWSTISCTTYPNLTFFFKNCAHVNHSVYTTLDCVKKMLKSFCLFFLMFAIRNSQYLLKTSDGSILVTYWETD